MCIRDRSDYHYTLSSCLSATSRQNLKLAASCSRYLRPTVIEHLLRVIRDEEIIGERFANDRTGVDLDYDYLVRLNSPLQ